MKVNRIFLILCLTFIMVFSSTMAQVDNIGTTYNQYVGQVGNEKIGTDTIKIEGENPASFTGENTVIENNIFDNSKALSTGDDSTTTWEFTVDDEGFYNVSIKYYTNFINTRGASREIYFDNKILFRDLLSVLFMSVWEDNLTDGRFSKNIQGNELRPKSSEVKKSSIKIIEDYSLTPFNIYFSKGNHSISFHGQKDKLVVDSITISSIKQSETYESLSGEYLKNGYSFTDSAKIKQEAEIIYQKSDFTIYPIFDKSSPASSPSNSNELKLNTIGREKWQTNGQWISWEMDVPKDGIYNIATRFRQDILSGIFVSRKLLIDGVVPFQEASKLRFNYSTDWQLSRLGNKQGAYSFYLTKGRHIFTLEVTQGDLAGIISETNDILQKLNDIYRDILIITGSNPDTYRDYDFEKIMPKTLSSIKEQAASLKQLSNQLFDTVGKKGEGTALLNKIVFQLEKMSEKPETIATQFNLFKSNLGALGSYIFSISNQPLELDYFLLTNQNDKLEGANSNFLESLVFNINIFLGSFFNKFDYSSIQNSEEQLEVWIPTGRDQTQILRNMSDNDFTPKSNIQVNIKLVTANTLLPATLAGRGPDVSLSAGAADPVNFAIRNAVVDLKEFSDLDTVLTRFNKEAYVPFAYDSALYALPENMSYPMLFYRKDIFNNLGITPPRTWTEFLNIIPIIKRKNMDIGVLPTASMLYTFMYQNGEEIYKDNFSKVNLDSNVSISAFKQVCDYYVLYKLPVTYDFANRFRTGEMPMAIIDRSAYNQLVVYAPEIQGLWEMVPIPGLVDKNGKINNTAPISITGVMMMKGTKNKQNSWEFMKWWTGKNAQATFGIEMESILGPAAKYPTANEEAFALLPWSSTEYKNLLNQQQNLKGIPMVPGNYILDRSIDFAFSATYNNGDNPVEAIESTISNINKELERKKWEFSPLQSNKQGN